MCKKLICLAFVGVLGLAPAAFGDLVGWWTFDEGADHRRPRFERQRLRRHLRRQRPVGRRHAQPARSTSTASPASTMATPPSCRSPGRSTNRRLGQAGRPDRRANPLSLGTPRMCSRCTGNGLRLTTPGVLDHTPANTVLEAKTWQHVAATFQPGQAGGAVFYLNGVETSRLNASALPVGTGPFRIGTNQWSEWFTGQIDEVRCLHPYPDRVGSPGALMNGPDLSVCLYHGSGRWLIACLRTGDAGAAESPVRRLAQGVPQRRRPGGDGWSRRCTVRHD